MNKQQNLQIDKSDIDEINFRKLVYWIDESCNVEVTEEKSFWVISFSGDVALVEGEISKFNKALNDFFLRKKISDETSQLREKIIISALNRVASDA